MAPGPVSRRSPRQLPPLPAMADRHLCVPARRCAASGAELLCPVAFRRALGAALGIGALRGVLLHVHCRRGIDASDRCGVGAERWWGAYPVVGASGGIFGLPLAFG